MYNLNMYTGKETLAVNETRGATHKVVMDVIDLIGTLSRAFLRTHVMTAGRNFTP